MVAGWSGSGIGSLHPASNSAVTDVEALRAGDDESKNVAAQADSTRLEARKTHHI
jgi:hypothetical protein